MSRTGCFMGDGLCQLLHCHPSQGPPLSLCFNYLFYHKHSLTLSKPFTDFFSFTTTHKVFLWLFRHICCHSAKKEEKKRKICYQAFSGKLCMSQFLCVCVLHLSELGLHHGPGVRPVREAGAVGGPAGQRLLHARIRHTRQKVWGQTGQSNTRQVGFIFDRML